MSNNYKKKATSFKPNKKLYRVMLPKASYGYKILVYHKTSYLLDG